MTVAPADTVTFLLTPLREGRHAVIDIALDGDIISTHAPAGGATPAGRSRCRPEASYFYSRPCGRGDLDDMMRDADDDKFLLTPLREGRREVRRNSGGKQAISTHAPAGGATGAYNASDLNRVGFLLTPLREGRRETGVKGRIKSDFYSRPCGRGDGSRAGRGRRGSISTHAPAGGATLLPCRR